MDVFLYSARAIIPLVIPITLGYVIAQLWKWPDDFYGKVNALAYRTLLPIQLFMSVATVPSVTDVNWPAVLYQLGVFLLMIPLAVVAARLSAKDRLQRAALANAVMRPNTGILGIPLVAALSTAPEASAFLAVSLSVAVPLMTCASVLLLSLYSGSKEHIRPVKLLKAVVTNPLVFSTALGLLYVLIDSNLPQTDGTPVFTLEKNLPALNKTMNSLSAAASPLMLIALGASLDFKTTGHLIPKIAAGVGARLVLLPAIFLALTMLLRERLHLTVIEMPALLAYICAPTSVSSVVMVQEIGGDAQLADQLVVWSSICSMVTIFLFVAFARTIGLL